MKKRLNYEFKWGIGFQFKYLWGTYNVPVTILNTLEELVNKTHKNPFSHRA